MQCTGTKENKIDNYKPVNGYRIVGERKASKELSYDYLMLSGPASHALNELRQATNVEEDKRRQGTGRGVPCVRSPEWFSGDELPTDREAQIACAPCPVKEQCDTYRRLAHPASGVYAGIVHGRKLEEALKDEEA